MVPARRPRCRSTSQTVRAHASAQIGAAQQAVRDASDRLTWRQAREALQQVRETEQAKIEAQRQAVEDARAAVQLAREQVRAARAALQALR
jgi:hypothetical protein